MGSIFQIEEFQQIAPGLSFTLIAFLAAGSQILFAFLDPEHLTFAQAFRFNALVGSLLLCYYRAWRCDPGRIPLDWSRRDPHDDEGAAQPESPEKDLELKQRWCRKCDMPKPPRAHHCKSCKRCIPKMDHHCPWTANCVSYRVMPHFIRFLFFSVCGISYLQYFFWIRLSWLYQNRRLPSFCCVPQYLGPTVTQLVFLFILTIVNSITLLGISLLFIRTLWCVVVNTTTIEGWEIERHENLVRRARMRGGVLEAPDGSHIRITRQEFPYDIGFWSNLAQAFGTHNVLAWFNPLARSLPIDGGLVFEENGFEEASKSWPPPDPDRMFKVRRVMDPSQAFTKSMDVNDFRRRQAEDLKRYKRTNDGEELRRRKPYSPYNVKDLDTVGGRIHELADIEESSDQEAAYESEEERNDPFQITDDADGEEAWRNAEGERLADFGVDEEVEFYDEDDLPLAKLMELRRQQAN